MAEQQHGASVPPAAVDQLQREYEQKYPGDPTYDTFLVCFSSEPDFKAYTGPDVGKCETLRHLGRQLHCNFIRHLITNLHKLKIVGVSIYDDHRRGATERLCGEFNKDSLLKDCVVNEIHSFGEFSGASTSYSKTPRRQQFLKDATELQRVLAPDFNYRVVNTQVHHRNPKNIDKQVLSKRNGNRHQETYKKKYITYMMTTAESEHEFLLAVVSAYGTDPRTYPSSVLDMMHKKKILKDFPGVSAPVSDFGFEDQLSNRNRSDSCDSLLSPTGSIYGSQSDFALPHAIGESVNPNNTNVSNNTVLMETFNTAATKFWRLFHGEAAVELPASWYARFQSGFPFPNNREDILTNCVNVLIWDFELNMYEPDTFTIDELQDVFQDRIRDIERSFHDSGIRVTPSTGFEPLLASNSSSLQQAILGPSTYTSKGEESRIIANSIPDPTQWSPSLSALPFPGFLAHVIWMAAKEPHVPATFANLDIFSINIFKLRYVEYLALSLQHTHKKEFLLGMFTAYGPNIMDYPIRVLQLLRKLELLRPRTLLDDLIATTNTCDDAYESIFRGGVPLPNDVQFVPSPLTTASQFPKSAFFTNAANVPVATKAELTPSLTNGFVPSQGLGARAPQQLDPNQQDPMTKFYGRISSAAGHIASQNLAPQHHYTQQYPAPANSPSSLLSLDLNNSPQIKGVGIRTLPLSVHAPRPNGVGIGNTNRPQYPPVPAAFVSSAMDAGEQTMSREGFLECITPYWKQFYGEQSTKEMPKNWFSRYKTQYPEPNNKNGILVQCVCVILNDQGALADTNRPIILRLPGNSSLTYLEIETDLLRHLPNNGPNVAADPYVVIMRENRSPLQAALIPPYTPNPSDKHAPATAANIFQDTDWCPGRCVFPFPAFVGHIKWYLQQHEKNFDVSKLDLEVLKMRFVEYISSFIENANQFLLAVFTAYGGNVLEFPVRVLEILKQRQLLRRGTKLFDAVNANPPKISYCTIRTEPKPDISSAITTTTNDAIYVEKKVTVQVKDDFKPGPSPASASSHQSKPYTTLLEQKSESENDSGCTNPASSVAGVAVDMMMPVPAKQNSTKPMPADVPQSLLENISPSSNSYVQWRNELEKVLQGIREDCKIPLDVPEVYFEALFQSYSDLLPESKDGIEDANAFRHLALGIWTGTQLRDFELDSKTELPAAANGPLSKIEPANNPIATSASSQTEAARASSGCEAGDRSLVSCHFGIGESLVDDAGIRILERFRGTVHASIGTMHSLFVRAKKMEAEILEKIQDEFSGVQIRDFVKELSLRICWIEEDEDLKATAFLVDALMKKKLISKPYVIDSMKTGVIQNLPELTVKLLNVIPRLSSFLVYLFAEEQELCWFFTLTDSLRQDYVPVFTELFKRTVDGFRRRSSQGTVNDLIARTPGAEDLL